MFDHHSLFSETTMELPRIDDEHNLIARYAAKLSSFEGKPARERQDSMVDSFTGSLDSFQLGSEFTMHQNLIDELEASNRQIMEEISHLRQSKDSSYSSSNLIFELQMLKQHKGELEGRMNKLQDGRQDLMEQLEKLMSLLKARDTSAAARGSPIRKSNHSSPRQPRQGQYFSPKHERLHSDGSVFASPKLTPQHSISSNSSSGYNSRTKKQFNELFNAADAINDALSHLVNHVTTDEEDAAENQCAPFPLATELDSVTY